MNIRKFILPLFIGMIIMVTGCTGSNQESNEAPDVKKAEEKTKFKMVETKSLNIEQIRGIGYPGNDDGLYIATDKGIKIHKAAQWFEFTSLNHDYMGFQAVEDGFLASGKPQKNTDLKDSLGIIHSADKGETLEKIAFYGENQFYFMGASFFGNGLYLINQEESEDLSLGVNFSLDKGESWKASGLENFQADSLGMIAVHPNSGDTIAMSTRSGIYYSIDNGDTMKQISEPIMVTAITFVGDELLYSSVENDTIHLKKLNPQSGEVISLKIPFLDYQNPITFLAVNPNNTSQIALTTYNNDLYESIDGGNSWTNLFINGKKEPK